MTINWAAYLIYTVSANESEAKIQIFINAS